MKKRQRVVHEAFNNKFDAWSKSKPNDNLPIAVIPEPDMALIGSKAKVAVLSPYTLNKQIDHHPELTIEDYLKAQDAITSGEKYQQTEKAIAYVNDNPDGLVLIIKATANGDELYMASLYRLSSKDKKRRIEINRLKKG